MNRSLSIPLAITAISFCVVYLAQTSFGEPITTNNLVAAVVNKPTTSVKPLAYQDVRTMILDEWPTLGEYHFGSRMAPTQPLYATLGELAQTMGQKDIDDDDSSFLCTLHISARPKQTKKRVDQAKLVNAMIKQLNLTDQNRFPVHVDRYTKEIHIFANRQWQDYSTWRETNLPKYQELTGWNAKTATRYGKRGFEIIPSKGTSGMGASGKAEEESESKAHGRP